MKADVWLAVFAGAAIVLTIITPLIAVLWNRTKELDEKVEKQVALAADIIEGRLIAVERHQNEQMNRDLNELQQRRMNHK